MSEKKKISSNPNELTFHHLQILAKDLKINDWQNKSRDELLKEINEISVYDKKKEQLERILEMTPNGFKPIGQIWLELFEKSKMWTSVISISLVLTMVVISTQSDRMKQQNAEKQKLENLEIIKQIENLNNVELNLKLLTEFVQQQKTNLNQTELKIQSLSKEKEELEPIVNANRDVIQAIFRQQNEYNKKDVWKERMIGFGLGILGSIIASIIFNLFRRNKIADTIEKAKKVNDEIENNS